VFEINNLMMHTSGSSTFPVALLKASPVVVPIISFELTEQGHEPSGLIGNIPISIPPIAGTGVKVTWPRKEMSPVLSTVQAGATSFTVISEPKARLRHKESEAESSPF
jgi:hypothetical protein